MNPLFEEAMHSPWARQFHDIATPVLNEFMDEPTPEIVEWATERDEHGFLAGEYAYTDPREFGYGFGESMDPDPGESLDMSPSAVKARRPFRPVERGILRKSQIPDRPLPQSNLKAWNYPFAKLEVDESFSVDITGNEITSARIYVMSRKNVAGSRLRKFSSSIFRKDDGTTWLRVWRDK